MISFDALKFLAACLAFTIIAMFVLWTYVIPQEYKLKSAPNKVHWKDMISKITKDENGKWTIK